MIDREWMTSIAKPLLKTLATFANTAGGRLVVGMDDLRQVVGVWHPLDNEECLCNLIASPRQTENFQFTGLVPQYPSEKSTRKDNEPTTPV